MAAASASFLWWNEATGNKAQGDSKPLCPSPRDAIGVWRKYCIFLLFEIDAYVLRDPYKYWEKVRDILEKYYTKTDIPDPVKHFPEFVNTLFLLQYIIKPQNTAGVITLIKSHIESSRLSFFVLKAPIIVDNPILYLETVNNVIDKEEMFWVKFSKNVEYALYFIQFHNHFLVPTNSQDQRYWKYRLLLLRIINFLLSKIPKAHCDFEDTLIDILDSISQMIQNCPDEAAINIARYFVAISKMIGKKCQIENVRQKYTLISENIPKDSAAYMYLYQFFLTTFKSRRITGHKLLMMVNYKKPNSATCFDIIGNLLGKAPNASILTCLAKTALSQPFWFRTGMMYIESIVVRQNNKDIDDWFGTFVRRLLIFVILSATLGKYQNRAIMICEFLGGVMEHEAPRWVKELIKNAGASMAENPACPPFLSFFIPISKTPDARTATDLKAFLQTNLNRSLKTFPFMKDKLFFALPAGGRRTDRQALRTAPGKTRTRAPKTKAKTKANVPSKKLAPFRPEAVPDISTVEDRQLMRILGYLPPPKPKAAKKESKGVTLGGSKSPISYSFSIRPLDDATATEAPLTTATTEYAATVGGLPRRDRRPPSGASKEEVAAFRAQQRAEKEFQKALERTKGEKAADALSMSRDQERRLKREQKRSKKEEENKKAVEERLRMLHRDSASVKSQRRPSGTAAESAPMKHRKLRKSASDSRAETMTLTDSETQRVQIQKAPDAQTQIQKAPMPLIRRRSRKLKDNAGQSRERSLPSFEPGSSLGEEPAKERRRRKKHLELEKNEISKSADAIKNEEKGDGESKVVKSLTDEIFKAFRERMEDSKTVVVRPIPMTFFLHPHSDE